LFRITHIACAAHNFIPNVSNPWHVFNAYPVMELESLYGLRIVSVGP